MTTLKTAQHPCMYMEPGTKADGSEDKVKPRRRVYTPAIVMAAIQAATMSNGMFSAYHVRGVTTEWTVGWNSRVSAKESSKVNEVWVREVELVTNTNAAGPYTRVAARTSACTADDVFLERIGVEEDAPFRLAMGSDTVRVQTPVSDLVFEERIRPIIREQAADLIEVALPLPGYEGQVLDEHNSIRLQIPTQGDARFAEIIGIDELKRRGDLL